LKVTDVKYGLCEEENNKSLGMEMNYFGTPEVKVKGRTRHDKVIGRRMDVEET
jgi:hypothetical protein